MADESNNNDSRMVVEENETDIGLEDIDNSMILCTNDKSDDTFEAMVEDGVTADNIQKPRNRRVATGNRKFSPKIEATCIGINRYHCLTMLDDAEEKLFEEIRWDDYQNHRNGPQGDCKLQRKICFISSLIDSYEVSDISDEDIAEICDDFGSEASSMITTLAEDDEKKSDHSMTTIDSETTSTNYNPEFERSSTYNISSNKSKRLKIKRNPPMTYGVPEELNYIHCDIPEIDKYYDLLHLKSGHSASSFSETDNYINLNNNPDDSSQISLVHKNESQNLRSETVYSQVFYPNKRFKPNRIINLRERMKQKRRSSYDDQFIDSYHGCECTSSKSYMTDLLDSSVSISHPSSLKCSRFDYYILPNYEQLNNYIQPDGASYLVPNFTIGRLGFGKVEFLDPLDITGLNIDEIVHFRTGAISMYPPPMVKPPPGEGLNRRATVTLENVRPYDRRRNFRMCNEEHLSKLDYISRLEHICEKQGLTFIYYDYSNGDLVFEVEHF